MNFLAPGAFFLGMLMPVIVALYLLKLRRIEREVPSTYLWRKMVRDVEANAPWQKLKPNLLMILQLLFLAAMILALARPFTWAEGAGGEAAILILDTSASMAASDVTPSRIESAKQRARQLVDDLPDQARVTVIEAGREARVLLSSSTDRRQAHLAIEEVRLGTGSSDMAVALELASAIAARQPGTEIIVLSDGRVDLPERMALKGALRYIPFGLNGENQAVSLLTLEMAPGGASLTAFAQVSNYGDETTTRRLSLFADGLLFNAYDLADIPAGQQRSVIAEGLPPKTQLIEAVLDGQDALALDDRALASRPSTQPVSVTLITQGNRFLETALSLLPGIVLTVQREEPPAAEKAPTIEPGQPTPTVEPTIAPVGELSTAPPALIIYDNTLPDQIPTEPSLLFIAPLRSTEFFNITGTAEMPTPRVVDTADPLITSVAFNEVSIFDSARISLPDWATPVVSGELDGENIPLLFRGEVSGRRIAVLSFDLRHSDLPLQVAFPLLTANLVDWLAPGTRGSVPKNVMPGESISFTAPNGETNAQITLPDGTQVPVTAQNGQFVFAETEQLGEYQIQFRGDSSEQPDSRSHFTVNLFSPQESSLDPADNLPNLTAQVEQAGSGGMRAMREWWRPLAFLALGLLFGEWLVYNRAALARLRDRLMPRKEQPVSLKIKRRA